MEAERPFLVGGDGVSTYGDLAAAVARERAQLAGGSECVVLEAGWGLKEISCLLGCLEAGRDCSLAGPVQEKRLKPFRSGTAGGLLLLRSGGSTGQPRTVVHAQKRFVEEYRLRAEDPLRQLILYAPDHVAGLDALLRAVSRGATLVRPEGYDARAIAHALEAERVEVLPATPSFLQFLILSGELAGRKLGTVRHIPHGAEPMPEAVRCAVRRFFPQARLHHRFGLTETGALPVAGDGEDPDRLRLSAEAGNAYAWKVVDGELWIRSPRRMLGTLEDGPLDPENPWYATGDRAEAGPDGSVRILGRGSSLINVGGEKVQPEQVEMWLMRVDGIQDVQVRGEPHALTGQAVVAEVVVEGGCAMEELRRRIRKAARAGGRPLVEIPVRLERVDTIGRTASGKRSRAWAAGGD